MNACTNNRPAFTLMEMLVVIALIGVLAGLAIYFVPSFQTSARAARGGADLQQWLNTARQRAIRDQAPRGLRILFGVPIAASPNGATEAASTVTITTTIPHGFSAGEDVWIAGVAVAAYNGVFTITSVPTTTTFTYTVAAAGLAPSGGGIASTGARKCQFIEVPDDVGGGRFFNPLPAPGSFVRLQLEAYNIPPLPPIPPYQPNQLVRVTGGADFNDQSVQVGDYIELNDGGLVHQIIDLRLDPPANTNRSVLVLRAPGLTNPLTTPVAEFRIRRQPRLTGDEVLELPRSIVIDPATNFYFGNALPPLSANGYLDIVFSPNGSVLAPNNPDRIHFWVRSNDEDAEYARPQKYFLGEPTLIVLYVNSGLIAAYPVNAGNIVNPYDLVR